MVGWCAKVEQWGTVDEVEVTGGEGGRRRERRAGWVGVKGGEMARVGKIRLSENVGEFVRVGG